MKKDLNEYDPLEIEDMPTKELKQRSKAELVDLIQTQANCLNIIESRTGFNAANCEDPNNFTG